VQAHIAAMPGWKSDVGRRLDALIVRTVPDVRKAVKWNSPLYGVEGQGWFLGIHCFRRTNVSGQRRSQPDPISRPTLVADPDTTRDPIEAVGEDTRVTGERQQP